MRKAIALISLATAGMGAPLARADVTLIWDTSGAVPVLVAANGVEVGQFRYDVTFADGAYSNFYPTFNGSPPFRPEALNSVEFSAALADQVFYAAIAGHETADTMPFTTRGCPVEPLPGYPCTILTPIKIAENANGPYVEGETLKTFSGDTADEIEVASWATWFGTQNIDYMTFALWSEGYPLEPSETVPEPSSLIVSLTALFFSFAAGSLRCRRSSQIPKGGA